MLANGIYTITHVSEPERPHRTFKVATCGAESKLAGKRILSLLTGPDNTWTSPDYRGFAFVGETITVWKAQRGENGKRSAAEMYARMFEQIFLEVDHGLKLEGYEVQESRRCMRCNRLLTDPESIKVGLGPECRQRN